MQNHPASRHVRDSPLLWGALSTLLMAPLVAAPALAGDAAPVSACAATPDAVSDPVDPRAADAPAEPLLGRYTVVPENEIVVSGLGAGLTAFDAIATAGGDSMGDFGSYSASGAALAAGRLTSTGLGQVGVLQESSGSLELLLLDYGFPATIQPTLGSPYTLGTTLAGSSSELAFGNVDSDGDDEIVVASVPSDGQLQLQVLELDGSGEALCTRVSATFDLSLAGTQDSLALVLADPTGEGDAHILVSWIGDDSAGYLSAFDVDESGLQQVGEPVQITSIPQPSGAFAVVAGALLSDTLAQQVVVADGVSVWTFAYTGQGSDGAWEEKGSCSPPEPALSWAPSNLYDVPVTTPRLAAGDLDLDGVDEVVLAAGGFGPPTPSYSYQVWLYVLAIDEQLRPTASLPFPVQGFDGTYVGSPNSPPPSGVEATFSLAAGTIAPPADPSQPSDPVPSTLVLAISWPVWGALGYPPPEPAVGFTQVALAADGTPSLPKDALNWSGWSTWQGTNPTASVDGLVLADLDGDSIWVGPPSPVQVTTSEGVVAVVNQVPVQADLNGDGTYVSFSDQQGNQTSLSSQVTSDFALSSELEGKLGGKAASLGASLKNTYQEGFERSQQDSVSVSQGLSVETLAEDAIITLASDYYLWEYPVYTGSGTTPAGHLLIAFNAQTVPSPGIMQADDLSSLYAPRHLVGEVLSYGTGPPDDYPATEPPLGDPSLTVGGDPQTYTFDYQQAQSNSAKTTSTRTTSVNVDAQVNFLGGGDLGITASLEGTYDSTSEYGTLQLQSVTFQESTTIELEIAPVGDDDEWDYTVQSYLYWSDPAGYLVVDHAVPELGGSNWTQYGTPDPAFYLPWAGGSEPAQASLTRSIDFLPQPDGTVAVTAVVANLSTSSADDVTVTFYQGDPTGSGVQIGEPQALQEIAPQGTSATLAVSWQPPADGCEQIYAVIDSSADADPENNTGFNVYPLSQLASETDPLCTGSS